MKVQRTASAAWSGSVREGKGAISTESGALVDYPYAYATRFGDKVGTNPEELLAAAHAGCFTMALSLRLEKAHLTASQLETTAQVVLQSVDGGFEISAVHLRLSARIPGASPEAFELLAKDAKENCPVSRLLRADVTLVTELLD